MECDVLVVGGGIAGLTSTAYLSKYKYKTILCESQPKLGGLIGSYEKNGFIFDQGIRAFENAGILSVMLKSFGINLEMFPNPVKIGIGDSFICMSDDNFLFEYERLLTSHFPNDSKEIKIIVQKIKKIMNHFSILYEIDNPILLEEKPKLEYLRKTLLPWFLKYMKSLKTVKEFNMGLYDFLNEITKNQSLIDMISQHFFKNTPANFALSYFGFYREYKYPKGSTSKLINELEEYSTINNAEILKNTSIIKIDVKKRIAYTSNNQTIKYKKMIWAANQKSLYNSLIDIPNSKTLKMKNLISKSKGSDSVLTLNLCANLDSKAFDIIGPHSFYTPFKEGISKLGSWNNTSNLKEWLVEYLKYTTYEISIPSLRDSSLSPNNSSGLIISTLFTYDLTEHLREQFSDNELKKIITETIIDIFDKHLFPNLKENISYSSLSTPHTVFLYTGNTDGSLTGWSYDNVKMPSTHKFTKITKSIKTPIPNIYQAGQWTFSPGGMPTGILTAKLAFDKIKKKVKPSL